MGNYCLGTGGITVSVEIIPLAIREQRLDMASCPPLPSSYSKVNSHLLSAQHKHSAQESLLLTVNKIAGLIVIFHIDRNYCL